MLASIPTRAQGGDQGEVLVTGAAPARRRARRGPPRRVERAARVDDGAPFRHDPRLRHRAGSVEFEQWMKLQTPRGSAPNHFWQSEIGVGLEGGWQLDLYENYGHAPHGPTKHDGVQFEARYALAKWARSRPTPRSTPSTRRTTTRPTPSRRSSSSPTTSAAAAGTGRRTSSRSRRRRPARDRARRGGGALLLARRQPLRGRRRGEVRAGHGGWQLAQPDERTARRPELPVAADREHAPRPRAAHGPDEERQGGSALRDLPGVRHRLRTRARRAQRADVVAQQIAGGVV